MSRCGRTGESFCGRTGRIVCTLLRREEIHATSGGLALRGYRRFTWQPSHAVVGSVPDSANLNRPGYEGRKCHRLSL
jgi:hypothetical protein